MKEIDPIEYGRLIQSVDRLTKDMEDIQDDIKAIKVLLEQATGGWKTLMWVGGACASAAAGVSWLLSHVTLK
jgi:hypothetical protein